MTTPYNKIMETEFLTLEQTAKYFGVHPRTILRWLKQGSLKGYKLGKGRTALLRIPKAEVKKFLEKHKIKWPLKLKNQ